MCWFPFYIGRSHISQGKKFRKPITYNACRLLSVYDMSVEFDGRFDVYRVFFSAFEKADIQLKIKAWKLKQ